MPNQDKPKKHDAPKGAEQPRNVVDLSDIEVTVPAKAAEVKQKAQEAARKTRDEKADIEKKAEEAQVPITDAENSKLEANDKATRELVAELIQKVTAFVEQAEKDPSSISDAALKDAAKDARDYRDLLTGLGDRSTNEEIDTYNGLYGRLENIEVDFNKELDVERHKQLAENVNKAQELLTQASTLTDLDELSKVLQEVDRITDSASAVMLDLGSRWTKEEGDSFNALVREYQKKVQSYKELRAEQGATKNPATPDPEKAETPKDPEGVRKQFLEEIKKVSELLDLAKTVTNIDARGEVLAEAKKHMNAVHDAVWDLNSTEADEARAKAMIERFDAAMKQYDTEKNGGGVSEAENRSYLKSLTDAAQKAYDSYIHPSKPQQMPDEEVDDAIQVRATVTKALKEALRVDSPADIEDMAQLLLYLNDNVEKSKKPDVQQRVLRARLEELRAKLVAQEVGMAFFPDSDVREQYEAAQAELKAAGLLNTIDERMQLTHERMKTFGKAKGNGFPRNIINGWNKLGRINFYDSWMKKDGSMDIRGQAEIPENENWNQTLKRWSKSSLSNVGIFAMRFGSARTIGIALGGYTAAALFTGGALIAATAAGAVGAAAFGLGKHDEERARFRKRETLKNIDIRDLEHESLDSLNQMAADMEVRIQYNGIDIQNTGGNKEAQKLVAQYQEILEAREKKQLEHVAANEAAKKLLETLTMHDAALDARIAQFRTKDRINMAWALVQGAAFGVAGFSIGATIREYAASAFGGTAEVNADAANPEPITEAPPGYEDAVGEIPATAVQPVAAEGLTAASAAPSELPVAPPSPFAAVGGPSADPVAVGGPGVLGVPASPVEGMPEPITEAPAGYVEAAGALPVAADDITAALKAEFDAVPTSPVAPAGGQVVGPEGLGGPGATGTPVPPVENVPGAAGQPAAPIPPTGADGIPQGLPPEPVVAAQEVPVTPAGPAAPVQFTEQALAEAAKNGTAMHIELGNASADVFMVGKGEGFTHAYLDYLKASAPSLGYDAQGGVSVDTWAKKLLLSQLNEGKLSINGVEYNPYDPSANQQLWVTDPNRYGFSFTTNPDGTVSAMPFDMKAGGVPITDAAGLDAAFDKHTIAEPVAEANADADAASTEADTNVDSSSMDASLGQPTVDEMPLALPHDYDPMQIAPLGVEGSYGNQVGMEANVPGAAESALPAEVVDGKFNWKGFLEKSGLDSQKQYWTLVAEQAMKVGAQPIEQTLVPSGELAPGMQSAIIENLEKNNTLALGDEINKIQLIFNGQGDVVRDFVGTDRISDNDYGDVLYAGWQEYVPEGKYDLVETEAARLTMLQEGHRLLVAAGLEDSDYDKAITKAAERIVGQVSKFGPVLTTDIRPIEATY